MNLWNYKENYNKKESKEYFNQTNNTMTKQEISQLSDEQIKSKKIWTGEELLLLNEVRVEKFGQQEVDRQFNEARKEKLKKLAKYN